MTWHLLLLPLPPPLLLLPPLRLPQLPPLLPRP